MPRKRILPVGFTAGEISPVMSGESNVGIVNRALRMLGNTPNREALERAIVDQAMLGTSAVHIGIDPAAPNGDMAAIAVRTVGADGTATVNISTANAEPAPSQGLTLESLQRARELLDRNMIEPRINRHGRQESVEITFDQRPDISPDIIECTTFLREMRNCVRVDRETLRPENFPNLARETAREFAAFIEQQVLEGLIRAHERMNGQRYHQNRTWEAMRHMVDIAPGALNYVRPEWAARLMTGGEAPEKKGPIKCLEDFKYKQITHNGWTAKVLDTFEAVKEEGKNMGHCLGGAYTNRIDKGEYVAVHITAPEGAKLPKSGFTLGFHRKKNKLTYDQLKGKKNDMSHCSHSGLLWFVDMVEKAYAGKSIPADAVVS